jgi:hypothetical protein
VGKRGRDDLPKVAMITGGNLTDIEKKIPLAVGQAIQASICVPPTGDFDVETREAIRQAKLGANRSRDTPTFGNTRSQLSSQTEVEIFAAARSCNLDSAATDRKYASAYEKFRFADRAAITSLQRQLAKCDPRVKETGTFDADTRSGIRAAKDLIKADPVIGANLTSSEISTDTLNDRTHQAVQRKCI